MSCKGDLAKALLEALQEMDEDPDLEDSKKLLARMFELAGTASCFVKAAPDEPIFVIRGQDGLASTIVGIYAMIAKAHGCAQGKVTEVVGFVKMLATWQDANPSRVKKPD